MKHNSNSNPNLTLNHRIPKKNPKRPYPVRYGSDSKTYTLVILLTIIKKSKFHLRPHRFKKNKFLLIRLSKRIPNIGVDKA